LEIKELSRYKDIEERIKFDDHSFEAFGIDWVLEVCIGSPKETGKWVEIYLHNVAQIQ
jgi:hypothetical protein